MLFREHLLMPYLSVLFGLDDLTSGLAHVKDSGSSKITGNAEVTYFWIAQVKTVHNNIISVCRVHYYTRAAKQDYAEACLLIPASEPDRFVGDQGILKTELPTGNDLVAASLRSVDLMSPNVYHEPRQPRRTIWMRIDTTYSSTDFRHELGVKTSAQWKTLYNNVIHAVHDIRGILKNREIDAYLDQHPVTEWALDFYE